MIDMRARPSALLRDFRQRAEHVEPREGLRQLLQPFSAVEHRVCKPLEDVQFAGERAIGGGGDLVLQLDELARRETHGVGHGLAMGEGFVERRTQQLLALRRRRFEKEAQEIIVLDLQL